MLYQTDDKSTEGRTRSAAHRLYVLLGVLLSAGLHAGAVVWWIQREAPAPMQLGMQEVTVELIAPPAPQPVPVPPAVVAPSPPEPETLREDDMALTHKVVKKPPKPKPPRPPVEQPARPQAEAAPVAAPVVSQAPVSDVAPAAASLTNARYDADYLNNPAPTYPPLSRRLGEEGTVILRVQVSADGAPLTVEIKQSSGFARLDEVARKQVAKWRFVPARQDGSSVVSWVDVPVQFSLKK